MSAWEETQCNCPEKCPVHVEPSDYDPVEELRETVAKICRNEAYVLSQDLLRDVVTQCDDLKAALDNAKAEQRDSLVSFSGQALQDERDRLEGDLAIAIETADKWKSKARGLEKQVADYRNSLERRNKQFVELSSSRDNLIKHRNLLRRVLGKIKDECRYAMNNTAHLTTSDQVRKTVSSHVLLKTGEPGCWCGDCGTYFPNWEMPPADPRPGAANLPAMTPEHECIGKM